MTKRRILSLVTIVCAMILIASIPVFAESDAWAIVGTFWALSRRSSDHLGLITKKSIPRCLSDFGGRPARLLFQTAGNGRRDYQRRPDLRLSGKRRIFIL